MRCAGWLLICCGFLTIIGLQQPRPATGCAVVYREGVGVAIAREAALIVWDGETRTEHFFRRGDFLTNGDDFGFLVPTPTKPTLTAGENSVFATLSAVTAPKRRKEIVRLRDSAVFGCGAKPAAVGMAASRNTPDAQSVVALEQTTVGDYDAAILESADGDTDAIGAWLTKNGYAYRPALREWVKFYIDRKWKLTAFKLTRDKTPPTSPQAQVGQAQLRPVCMSFTTERPFYPYLEPHDAGASAPPADAVPSRGGVRQRDCCGSSS